MKGVQGKLRSHGSDRLLSFVLFLAVFFLPLHFHAPTIASPIAKECSCLSGARTESGLAPAIARWLPAFEHQPVRSALQVWTDRLFSQVVLIRAPPALAS
jgi:hypothetical protein